MTDTRYDGPTQHRSTMTEKQRELIASSLLGGLEIIKATPQEKYAAALKLAYMTDPEAHEAWLKACRGEEWRR